MLPFAWLIQFLLSDSTTTENSDLPKKKFKTLLTQFSMVNLKLKLTRKVNSPRFLIKFLMELMLLNLISVSLLTRKLSSSQMRLHLQIKKNLMLWTRNKLRWQFITLIQLKFTTILLHQSSKTQLKTTGNPNNSLVNSNHLLMIKT